MDTAGCGFQVPGALFSLWVHFVSFLCCDASQGKLAQALDWGQGLKFALGLAQHLAHSRCPRTISCKHAKFKRRFQDSSEQENRGCQWWIPWGYLASNAFFLDPRIPHSSFPWMAVSAPDHIDTQLLVLLLGSKTGHFDLQYAVIPTSSVKSWHRGQGEMLIHLTKDGNWSETKFVAKVASSSTRNQDGSPGLWLGLVLLSPRQTSFIRKSKIYFTSA